MAQAVEVCWVALMILMTVGLSLLTLLHPYEALIVSELAVLYIEPLDSLLLVPIGVEHSQVACSGQLVVFSLAP